MCKDFIFHFGAEEIAAMETVKDLITCSPVLHPLNYAAHDWPIILAIDSSITAIGYVLMQVRDDKQHGLFCTLHAYRIYIIGVRNLIVEVDTKYLKGMLNNPDIQLNATINQWIIGILLFNFKLVHVPAIHHTATNGLSH
jgi:hypothetical protein